MPPGLRLFFRLMLRPLGREPLRTALTVLAVALGVAVVLAIELAGGAAAGSFRSSLETLAGDADFEITAPGGVPADVVSSLARLPYPLSVRPRIEDYAVAAPAGRTVPLIGLDLVAQGASFANGDGERGSAEAVERDDAVWTGADLALRPGDRLRLLIHDQTHNFVVRGSLGDAAGDAVVMDLALATRVLRRTGALDRVLVGVPERAPAGGWERVLGSVLPTGVTLAPFGSRTEENRRMLAAFRWNLRVLSYIALIVGAFLIYNTISVSVVRRRTEIGVLRALGATRRMVLAAFLGEALLFGLAGAAAGIGLGRLLASSAVGMLSATVESLYVSSRPGAIGLSWETAVLAVAAGAGVAALSALAPAWEASRVAPVEAMSQGRREHETRIHKRRSLAFAMLLGVAAFAAARQPAVDGKPVFGYLGALLMIGASALAIPTLVWTVGRVRAGANEVFLAARGLAGSLRRTSVLVGALSTAIAMMTAVGIMVGSFRETVLVWMDDRLQADLYVRAAAPSRADYQPAMLAEIPGLVAQLPQVDAVYRFRAYRISFRGKPATLGGGDALVAGRFGRRPFLSGAKSESVFAQLAGNDSVIVSETFSNKHGVRAGDLLELPLGGLVAAFRVIDVYYDYSSEQGYIVMDRRTLLNYLPDPAPSSVAVYLKPGVAIEDGRKAVEAALAPRKVRVVSNRTVREEAIRIFDRTFAITYALEAVAVVVAVMGVAGALLALVIDRRREFGLLRFFGAGAGQVRRIILFEAGLLGLLANFVGFVIGVLLSLLLIFVINKQSFGWTIQFHWPVGMLLAALSVVYIATVLAGIYPARVAARLNPIEAVHEE